MGGWSVGLPRKADGNPQKQPARCAVWLWCVGEVRAGPVEGQGEEEPRGSEARRKAKSTPGAGGGGCCQPLFPEEGRLLGISGDCRVFQGVLELQVPESDCLSCFLRQCAAHTPCQVNPNSPSCLAPQSAGALLEQGSQGADSGAKELGKHLRPEK